MNFQLKKLILKIYPKSRKYIGQENPVKLYDKVSPNHNIFCNSVKFKLFQLMEGMCTCSSVANLLFFTLELLLNVLYIHLHL